MSASCMPALPGWGVISRKPSLAPEQEDSVMGWLAQTRLKLSIMAQAQQAADVRNQRLTGLYNALSQCNQAIVRSRSERELFEQICQAAVEHGGMKWCGSAAG
jgi:hypothetical protein